MITDNALLLNINFLWGRRLCLYHACICKPSGKNQQRRQNSWKNILPNSLWKVRYQRLAPVSAINMYCFWTLEKVILFMSLYLYLCLSIYILLCLLSIERRLLRLGTRWRQWLSLSGREDWILDDFFFLLVYIVWIFSNEYMLILRSEKNRCYFKL